MSNRAEDMPSKDPIGEADFATLVRDMGPMMAGLLATMKAFAEVLGHRLPVEAQALEGPEEGSQSVQEWDGIRTCKEPWQHGIYRDHLGFFTMVEGVRIGVTNCPRCGGILA